MATTKKIPEFEAVYKLYTTLKAQINRMEGPNGYLKKSFQMWNEDTFACMMKNREDKNILISQEKDEEELKAVNSDKSLRFFKPYYDEYSLKISKGEIPDFLRSRDLKLDIDMPRNTADTRGMEKAKQQYESLTVEQKRDQVKKIAKELAIIFARHANILNRFKSSRTSNFEETMKAKHMAMEHFMVYAISYNKIVAEKDKIVFGIDNSEKGPVLSASLPGYTRLSLHFGGAKICKDLLKNTNTRVKQEYFPVRNNSKDIDLNEVYNKRGYSLPTFGIINTGIINHIEHENSEEYAKQMRDIVEKTGIDDFVNNIHPELNSRETFYIAEMAGLGKENLEKLREALLQRQRRQSKAYGFMYNSAKMQGVLARKRADDMDTRLIMYNQKER